MDKIRIGLVGFGTAGTGTVRCLLEGREWISRQAGIQLDLAGIADVELERDRGIDLGGIPLTRDAGELIRSPEIDVIVELVGGTDVARQFIEDSLDLGKDVVTANKALLAIHGADLFERAERKGCLIGYEAAVCGGIPVIDALNNGVSATRVSSIYGIINGTCNYILTKMSEGAGDYQAVLSEAQSLGYAEADPTADVEGVDAAHKIVILASLAFGQQIDLSDIHCEGISQVSAFDLDYARELGYVVKLLAVSKEDADGIQVRVHPTMIPRRSLLASVGGVFNAVRIEGRPLGSVMLYGPGAGADATGNAVVSDLIQLARLKVGGGLARSFRNFYTPGKKVKPMADTVCPYYLRFRTLDQPGVIAKISKILGDRRISIASMIQHQATHPDWVPVVLMTHRAREKDIMEALALIDRLEVIVEKSLAMRVEQMEEG